MIHISKGQVLLIYLSLINSLFLHDMLCGSLGVIKFDIELVAIYSIENIHLLLNFKMSYAQLGGCH